MKNKEFRKLLKKNKSNSNSGFTLTELLVGLVMSTIVVAGLGWGLMQMLRTTQTETSKVASRNETSRAFNFIADEVKAAQFMEVNMSSTHLATVDNAATPDINEEVAPDFSLPSGGTVRLALRVPGVSQRIIYYVAPPQTATWNGPLVIYRWGPGLKADGSYIDDPTSNLRVDNPAGWRREALIDGVSDETLTAVGCDMDGDSSDDTYEGFFACIVDDDGDTIVDAAGNPVLDAAGNPVKENATDTNGDGTIDSNDSGATDINRDGVVDNGDGADTDGVSITAQLYFAGGKDTDVYKTDSQVVARARVAPLRKPELNETKLLEFEPLPFNYGRNINNDPDNPCWTVRNDFGQGDDPTARPGSGNELQNTMTWIHENNRQPQPLNIDTNEPLTIVASAFGGLNNQCLARGNKHKRIWDSINNEYRYVDSAGNALDSDTDDGSFRVAADGTEKIHTYEHKVWHTIDFSDPDTFNGTDSTVGPEVTSSDSNPRGDNTVKIFKNGDVVSNDADYSGYDENNDGISDQDSIVDFLRDQGYVNENGEIELEPNQRIIAFEIGQDDAGTDSNPNPGFDLQDTIFIMTSDAFISSDSDDNSGYGNGDSSDYSQ